MTDAAWAKGMADLVAMLPDSSTSDETVREHRASLYRRILDYLSDDAWLHAVSEAIARERWFPSVAVLREYGESFTPSYPALPPARDVATREADRAEAKRGLELCRAAFERATGEKAP